jgi:hypothetical protein
VTDRVQRIRNSPNMGHHLFGVAIGRTDAGNLHTGILVAEKRSVPAFIHLKWDKKVRKESAAPTYLTVWVSTNLPSSRQRQIANYCRLVFTMNWVGGIPYGFSTPENAFDGSTGVFVSGPKNYGLTCASFVLAVLEAAGLELARHDTWPTASEGDREWQSSMIALLKERNEVSKENLPMIVGEVGKARYRPDHVAGLLSIAPPPGTFEDAEGVAFKIVGLVDSVEATDEKQAGPA